MRVGLVAGEYPPMQGGVGAFTRELARALYAQGHEVHLFTRKHIPALQGDGILIDSKVRGKWGWNTISAVAKWQAQHRLEVINIQFQTAAFDMHPAIHWLPSQIRHTPVVVTFHDLRYPYLFPKAGHLRTWVVGKLAHDAAGVIATDRADENTLRDWGISRICWIPIGSNVSTDPPPGYDSGMWRRERGIGLDDLVISYFGFLNESKGGLALIQALARIVSAGVPAHLVMIGGRAGSSDATNMLYGERVDAAISHHGLESHVHWTGFVSDAEVSAAFYASDLTALPYRDGVSLRRGTLMAALAHARAIVTTTPATAAPELDGAVHLVPPDDPGCLAEAILSLWRDAARRRALETAARRAAAHFTWDQIAARTVEFFEQLIQ